MATCACVSRSCSLYDSFFSWPFPMHPFPTRLPIPLGHEPPTRDCWSQWVTFPQLQGVGEWPVGDAGLEFRENGERRETFHSSLHLLWLFWWLIGLHSGICSDGQACLLPPLLGDPSFWVLPSFTPLPPSVDKPSLAPNFSITSINNSCIEFLLL